MRQKVQGMSHQVHSIQSDTRSSSSPKSNSDSRVLSLLFNGKEQANSDRLGHASQESSTSGVVDVAAALPVQEECPKDEQPATCSPV